MCPDEEARHELLAAALPPDGTEVIGMTHPNISEDMPAREVRGPLSRHAVVPALGYMRYFVGPFSVDPATIRPVD
jgi:hypothetical protein